MSDNNGTNISSEVKGRGLFYGVIAVATFIVMAVGATFAYFTATTNSGNTSVTAGSTTLQLKYISYEGAWSSNDLIPANTNVVQYSFERQNDTTLKAGGQNVDYANLLCKDDFGNSICSVYVFQVVNTSASPQQGLTMSVVSELNTFSSLHAMAYEVSVDTENENVYSNTEDSTDEETGEEITNLNGDNDPVFKQLNPDVVGEHVITVKDGTGTEIEYLDEEGNPRFTPVFINRQGVTRKLLNSVDEHGNAISANLVLRPDSSLNTAENVNERTVEVASGFEIPSGATATYALVIYIKNEETDQTETDAAKTFTGQVVVGSGDGSGVSGYIGAVSNN